MQTRHAKAKAYSSFCSQIVLVYLQPFHHNSLLKCVPQPKIAKNNKTPYFGAELIGDRTTSGLALLHKLTDC